MKTIDRILGEAKVRPPTERELTEPEWAYRYAKDVIRGRWPEAEEVIAKEPWSAYRYADLVIKGRWPEAEATIAKSPFRAHRYAKDVIKGRWLEGEEAIAKSEYKNWYLEQFPEARDDWSFNGWIDWLDV